MVARCMVVQVLDALPPDDRDLLRRRFHEDRAMGEIAECLGIAEDTVRKRIHRALAKARAAFTPPDFAEPPLDVCNDSTADVR